MKKTIHNPIQFEIDDINKKIAELERKRNALLKADEENFLEDAKKHIGRCFRINNQIYAKVLGVPVKDWRTGLNRYQFPAIFVTPDVNDVPFYYDTLFSGAWGVGNNINRTKYKEISQKIFDTIFEKCLNEFKEKVLNNRSL